ncbi:MAG: amidase [Planctomycetaceae bacterium]|nr:MAG: amidase [Planctomycetaceae bacterium]
MTSRAATEYRYQHLTWPEINEAVTLQKLVILPVGSTEQHGPHLPLDVDAFLCEAVCHEVGRRLPDQVLILPTVAYGLNLHHIDFPGTIHIEPEVFISFCLNITKSVAYHGFPRILIVNGHGSNGPLVDLIARKTVLETPALCFATTYFRFLLEEYERIRETTVMAHADEFETSLYLYLAGDRVQMDKAVADYDRSGQFVSSDSTPNYPIRFNDYWSRWTCTGVHGDPTKATVEKGQRLFEAAVAGLMAAVQELRVWPVERRRDLHTSPAASQIRWS